MKIQQKKCILLIFVFFQFFVAWIFVFFEFFVVWIFVSFVFLRDLRG